jgi:hypothetical protein
MRSARAVFPVLLLTAVSVLALAGCNSPSEPNAAGALTLTTSGSEIPADGFSRVTLTAQIDPRAAADRRTVVFTTTAGTFAGATENGGKTLSLGVDSAGRAQVELQSGRNIETAVVTASVSTATETLTVQRVEVRFVAVDSGALVRLSTSTSSAPADGATPVRVYADIASGLPSGQRTVSFTTSLGGFGAPASQTPTATATADASNRATVDLFGPSDSVGQARVTATVGGTTVQTFVDFVRAYPDTIVVSPSKLQLQASASDSLTVTITLLRNLGTVTAGTPVTVKVLKPNNEDLQFLINGVAPSGTGGTTQATVSAGATTYRGTAIIEVSVPGTSVKGRATIEIIDP